METKNVKHAGEVKGLLQFLSSLYDYTDECVAVLSPGFEIIFSSTSFRNAVYGDARFSGGKKLKLYNGKNSPLKLSSVKQTIKKRGVWKGNVRLGVGTVFRGAYLKLTCIKNPPFAGKLMLGMFRFSDSDAAEIVNTGAYRLFTLLNDTIINANRSNDIYSSIQYSIDRICAFTRWEIGHCFLVISEELYSTKIWNSGFNPADNAFREFSDRVNFNTRESMASECVKKQSHFRMKLKNIDTGKFKRIAILRELGYKAGYWYPLKLKDEVSGVLEFFSRKETFTDTQIFEGINNVSYELGSMIQRIRASEAARINDKMIALGRFSAGIAHEIRNPLANISALSQLLLHENLSQESKQHLEYIVENTNIANGIISGLLNYVSAGESHFEKCDFRKLVTSVSNMAELRCRGTKVKFVKNIARAFPYVLCDKVRLESAVLNIIANAVDSIRGRGSVALEAFPSRENDFINILIKDTGEGISEENLDKIFDPFYSTKDTGTGLGLTLSLQTISSHGGTLNIKSRPGAGTTAEIRLPAERKT